MYISPPGNELTRDAAAASLTEYPAQMKGKSMTHINKNQEFRQTENQDTRHHCAPGFPGHSLSK
jgi:hypothetical protein